MAIFEHCDNPTTAESRNGGIWLHNSIWTTDGLKFQSIWPETSHYVTGIESYWSKVGSPVGTLCCRIEETSYNTEQFFWEPNGTVLETSATTYDMAATGGDAFPVYSPFKLCTFPFAGTTLLLNTKVYAFVFYTPTFDGNPSNNYVNSRGQHGVSITDGYARGSHGCSTTAPPVTWLWGNQGEDIWFSETGNEATTSTDVALEGLGSNPLDRATGVLNNQTIHRKINLIPFIYSYDITYMMEFGEKYIRFFKDDSVLLSDIGAEVWITTPYLTEHLFELQFKQIGDIMRITHPAYPVATLRRTSETSFSLQVIPFSTGPFLVRHDLDSDDGVTLTSSVAGYLQGTLSYNLTALHSETGHNNITSYQWDGNASHGLGGTLDYCGGGTLDGTQDRKAWITYTLEFPDVIASLPSIDITYICMSQEGSTVRGLKLWTTDGGGSWITVTDASFAATSPFTDHTSTDLIPTHAATVTFDSGSTPSAPWTNISKIEIYLYAEVNGTGLGAFHDICACMLFNVVAAGVPQRTGTLTASSDLFSAGQIGSLFKLIQPRLTTVSTGTYGGQINDYLLCEAIPVFGEFRFTTSGSWYGTVQLQRRENSLSEDDWEVFRTYRSGWPPDFNANYTYTEDNYNVEYRVKLWLGSAPNGESNTITASIIVSDSMQEGIVRIDSIVSPTVANITVIVAVASTDPTKRWAEGAWSGVRNYPTSCTFIEERCVYAGMNIQTSGAKLLKVWLSHSADYDNFTVGVNAADSFEVTIPTTNTISWIDAMDNLTIATDGGTWFIRSNKIDSPLVPVPAPIVRSQSGYGCDWIQPVDGGKAMVYVSGRQVRELGYEKESAQFDADLTALAEHFTQSPIIEISMQYDPYQILWCVHEDGTLSALVYEREQNCIGWSHIPIIDGEVQSVCVTPGELADDIWLAVQRTIDGESVIYIEKIKPQFVNSDTLIEDLYYVDCGITYDDAATSTITGLGHLEGKTVSVLGNGIVFDDAIVTGEQITTKLATIETTVTKAQIGLSYKSKLQPMRIITTTPYGSSQGAITRIPKMSISFLNTMDAVYGSSDNELLDINWDDSKWENSADIDGLFTGEVEVTVNGGFSVQNPIIISTDSPLPCIVRSIQPRLEVTGS